MLRFQIQMNQHQIEEYLLLWVVYLLHLTNTNQQLECKPVGCAIHDKLLHFFEFFFTGWTQVPLQELQGTVNLLDAMGNIPTAEILSGIIHVLLDLDA